MKFVKGLILSVLVSVVLIDAKDKQPDVKVSKKEDVVHAAKSSKFDLNEIAQQAKDLVEFKNKISVAIESCYDLIDQLEQRQREYFHDSKNNKGGMGNMSDQQIEDQVQRYLEGKLNGMFNDVLGMNKKLATELINNSRQPSKGVEFANS